MIARISRLLVKSLMKGLSRGTSAFKRASPRVQLRGAPLMKYQGDHVMEFEDGKSVRTLGSGFRYLLMRKIGTKIGIDFAASQDDFAFYIIFGSAWFR